MLYFLQILVAMLSLPAYSQEKPTSVPTPMQAPTPTQIERKDGLPPSMVDFESFLSLSQEVYAYRKNRLVALPEFLKMSKEPGTVILDTRSDAMYTLKHVKGAIHLDFTDFTAENLARTIPNPNTRILIYCNNNFADDPIAFTSKIAMPDRSGKKPVSLALNVPTFINLYGYGYKNIYELSSLVSVYNGGIEFEGTPVRKVLKLRGQKAGE